MKIVFGVQQWLRPFQLGNLLVLLALGSYQINMVEKHLLFLVQYFILPEVF